jgi:YVTN family beta-propeller protein
VQLRIRRSPRLAAAVLGLCSWPALAQPQPIDASNWGKVVSPVWGTNSGLFGSGPEMFAGPNQFGAYFSGVLPNGKIVKPAGVSVQVGMNPLGVALTPDGRYLVTTNDNSRSPGASVQNTNNISGYSLSVVDTATMQVVSRIAGGKFFVGVQVTGPGPYTVWASGGADHLMYLYTISTTGTIAKATPASIAIKPILPATAGYVSNYVPDARLNAADSAGFKPPVPTNFSRTTGAQLTFPAGSALSPDGKFLYVACNGDNSVAVINTATMKVVRQVPVGYFPYGVAVSSDGQKVLVTNWGVSEYKFWNPTYDPDTGKLLSIASPDGNQADGFYVPVTDTDGPRPKTSSVSILRAAGGNGAALMAIGAVYQGKPLDELYQVGDTHPSAAGIVRNSAGVEVLYVTKSNSDAIGMIRLNDNVKLADFDLSPISITLADGHSLHGAYPNALAVSPDNRRVYVAEAGINSVAVLDTTNPERPQLLGRIPTGWYPSAVTISSDGTSLYVVNAKGIGEDLNPNTDPNAKHRPTGIVSQSGIDSNYIFGTVQKVDLGALTLDNTSVLRNNYAVLPAPNADVVPIGGTASTKIKHVFFILHENKTFDSILGGMQDQFGKFAATTFNDVKGASYDNLQYTRVAVNTQALAGRFATAVNYYSDSEESDAGHQFTTSGTATDYTEKILAVKSGRGLLVTKNMEAENYPEGGYIFNNAARNGVSFKNYGDLTRIAGTDEGSSTPNIMNDPMSGNLGYPQLKEDKVTITSPLQNGGDVSSQTRGLGQSYFLATPTLSILGGRNTNGEARLDRNYPGWNFNISDQRRALQFIADFDRMVRAGTVPQFLYIYQPNDHTGSATAANAKEVGTTAAQQVADGDVALGMVINHIMQSPIYYDPKTGDGSAIFVTWDDAQATVDHIHPHRTPLLAIGPYVKPSFVATRHYSSASIVKTEELLLGLPPNNLGDLFATDLRDMFQPTYNGITADTVPVNRSAKVVDSPEGRKVWDLVAHLDTSAPDEDSKRLGALGRLSLAADDLYEQAAAKGQLKTRSYRSAQSRVYKEALRVVKSPKPRDADD